MLGSKGKRLAALEQQLAATHAQAVKSQEEALWAQFSDDELNQIISCLERREQPGYVLTAEDEAIERRWAEAVRAVVTEAWHWQAWALAWCEAITNAGFAIKKRG